MTRVFNDPDHFLEEMVEGLAAASGRWVSQAPGGVIRSAPAVPGSVAVVIGGGSGHYPAFAGLVGPGLAHGAAMGNLFASPSAQQVYNVASRCSAGGGVLLTYGNYAGDVLNFDEAQDRLRAEGVACETVVVTDDISSAPTGQEDLRRGIAGDLVVFKAAGAAADTGADLATVTAIARRANDVTRSIGVAFAGCTLPGAAAPLFTVPDGRMAVGLGVHGEPGLYETEMASAEDLAGLMVDALLDQVPAGASSSGRVAAVLNGLGSIKYEELFVLYRSVNARLEGAGLRVVDPEVGELVTSFDMAGVSLTMAWLDDELEALWRAPADGAGYRKLRTGPEASRGPAMSEHSAAGVTSDPDGATGPAQAAAVKSAAAARIVAAALQGAVESLAAEAAELGRLDAVAGDGDHGIGMERGVRSASRAASGAIEDGAGLRTVLLRAGEAWSDQAGGTSGALWGALLRAAGLQLSDESGPSPADLAAAVAAAAEAVGDRGKAVPGDKTMLDALVPLREVFASALAGGAAPAVAWRRAVKAADEAAQATATMLPRIGRARPHAEHSLGSPDPGAVSLVLVARAVLTAVEPAHHAYDDQP